MEFRAHVIVCALAAITATPAAAQDLASGEALYQKSCRNCHGPRAQGMASFPKLSHQSEEYLVMRLEQYRAGEKVGPNSALMEPNARSLSDEDITDLAAYIATSFD